MQTGYTVSNSAARITRVGLAANLLLAVAKLLSGWFGRSQAAVADALHSISDMGTDIAILTGMHFWSAPADAGHPYGHRRIETLVTLGLGISVALGAIALLWNAAATLRVEPERPPAWFALSGSVITLAVKEWLYRRTRRVGEEVNSSALRANAWHHRSDALSSVPVILSVIAVAINPAWYILDRIGTLIVGGMILGAAWRIVYPALVELTDAGASGHECRAIIELAECVAGIRAVHKVRTRRMASGLYVDLHAEVDGAMSVHDGHDLATQLQRRLIAEGPTVVDVVVHIEPAPESGGNGPHGASGAKAKMDRLYIDKRSRS